MNAARKGKLMMKLSAKSINLKFTLVLLLVAGSGVIWVDNDNISRTATMK